MSEVRLHFVGNGLYGSKRFTAEARRIGVQRAVPFVQLQNFKWGDPIVLAEHVSTQNAESNLMESVAVGFGYFQVENVVYQLPENIKAKVVEQLNVVGTVESSGLETRACGSYILGGGYTVTDSIQDIVGYIETVCKAEKKDPREFKYFLRGAIKTFDEPTIIHNQPFFRGYKKVDLPDFKFQRTKSKRVLNIYNYSRRMYLKKKEREALDSTLLDEFRGGEKQE